MDITLALVLVCAYLARVRARTRVEVSRRAGPAPRALGIAMAGVILNRPSYS